VVFDLTAALGLSDVAKFLCVTLKRVSLPHDASSHRLTLMRKLDELQQTFPQLYWELEDDDSCGNEPSELASSMKLLLFRGLNRALSDTLVSVVVSGPKGHAFDAWPLRSSVPLRRGGLNS